MLKINIVAIGKIKDKYIIDGIAEYEKRLRPYINFSIIELNENKDSYDSHIKDSENIMKFLKKDNSYNILMDINSKMLDSISLSNKIEDLSLNNSSINFIIGGSRGVSTDLKNYVDYKISFSKLTFPHQLFRLMLIEQIYRAISISKNIKYHK